MASSLKLCRAKKFSKVIVLWALVLAVIFAPCLVIIVYGAFSV